MNKIERGKPDRRKVRDNFVFRYFRETFEAECSIRRRFPFVSLNVLRGALSVQRLNATEKAEAAEHS